MLEGAARIHVTSAREGTEAAAFAFNLPPFVEIPNGVDLVSPAASAELAPRTTALLNGSPFLLFVGRISWKKGLDRLVPALTALPGTRLIVAGSDEEGSQAALTELAVTAGVADRVVFCGPVNAAEKGALFSRALALVLPSYSENFGNVVLEAMAAGRPVIVSSEVGLADLVDATGSGVVIRGGAEPLGGAIARLSKDTAAGDAMGRNGTAAAARYSWDNVAAQMETLYESIRRSAGC